MLLHFKAGWVRFAFGVVFLSLLILLVHEIRQVREPIHHPLIDPRNLSLLLPVWAVLAAAADLAATTVCITVGALLLPRRFRRAVLRSSATLFHNLNLPLILAGALLAGGLEEILFRAEIQPTLVDEFGDRNGALGTAGLFALLHWTPFTNVLAILAFPRSLVYSTAALCTGNPLVACLGRLIAEFIYLWGVRFLITHGLTPEEPDSPEYIA